MNDELYVCERCGERLNDIMIHPDFEDNIYCHKCGDDEIGYRESVYIDQNVDRDR